jgi:SHS family lactate transporter-like MFS transporter
MLPKLSAISRGHWNVLSAGTLAFFFDSWDAFLLVYVLSDVAETFHIPLAKASTALLFTYMSRWLGGILFGSVSSRWGRRRSLMISMLLCGIFTMLTGAAPSFAVLLACRLCFGIGMGGLYAAAGPFVVESVPDTVRGFASGFFMFGFYVGSVVAPWTYYLCQPRFGWRVMFYFGGVSLLLVPYIACCVPESPVWLARRSQLDLRPEETAPMWKLFAPPYLPITLALLFVEIGVFFCAYPFQSVLPTYLKLERHFPIHEVALAGSMIGVGAIVGSLFGGAASDCIGRKKTFAIAFVLVLFPTSLAVLARSSSLIVSTSLANGAIFGCMGGLLTAFENEHYPTDLRAVGNGLLHNLGSFGGSIGAVAAAALHTSFGYSAAIIIITGAGVVLGLSGLAFTRETMRIRLSEVDRRPLEGTSRLP